MKELIQLGASQVVVPGNFPLGCFPAFLAVAKKNRLTVYDDFGCVKSVNNLTSYENDDIQGALNSLRIEFPNTVILYADYYNAFLSVLRQAIFGFDTEKLFIPCCGDDGVYNVFLPTFCGGWVCLYALIQMSAYIGMAYIRRKKFIVVCLRLSLRTWGSTVFNKTYIV
ncbi:UNVERIFIED_CONTAM: GDSL esterase/lipase [Sesamum radiatum]|uniref:GDSL esterase/lipase n=1 Tax=Sesamum radiatum TaxID=300843 RepID=A0AAW2SJ92_SESRA